MFLFSVCSTISANVAACLRMSPGVPHTNTAACASGRIMRAAPAVRALAVAAAHRSTPIRLDDRSLDAIADAEARTPYDPPAQYARARIAAAPSSLALSIHWPLPPAIARCYVGSSSTGTLPPASIHVAGNTRPEIAYPPLPLAVSPATPTPAIPILVAHHAAALRCNPAASLSDYPRSGQGAED